MSEVDLKSRTHYVYPTIVCPVLQKSFFSIYYEWGPAIIPPMKEDEELREEVKEMGERILLCYYQGKES